MLRKNKNKLRSNARGDKLGRPFPSFLKMTVLHQIFAISKRARNLCLVANESSFRVDYEAFMVSINFLVIKLCNLLQKVYELFQQR